MSGRRDYLRFAELDEGVEGSEDGGQKLELVDLGHEFIVAIGDGINGGVKVKEELERCWVRLRGG